jgi:hypothetical protein
MKKVIVSITLIAAILFVSVCSVYSTTWRTGKPATSETAAIGIPYVKDNFDYLKAWLDRVMINVDNASNFVDGINTATDVDMYLFHPFYSSSTGNT